jgi:CPA2 family monovalent cation:H+ antiporter-2
MAVHVDSHTLETTVLAVTVLMFALGAILSFILQRFHLPSFLAFILTGILLGSSGLNLIQEQQIRPLAQVGIIFLLFIVGLELSIDKLKQLRYRAPLAGMLQIIITAILLMLALHYWAWLPWQLAFLVGSILALSSTAIVLKSLEDYREMDTDHGRLILGILIIQDLSIILLMALVPTLVQPVTADMFVSLSWLLLKTVLFGAIAVGISLTLVPVFLDRLASTNRKELFTMALVCIGLGMALFTHTLGLSYEAGAFIAGLALSRSVFCRQVIADSKAFRDVFITLFFVSMGLLFNVKTVLDNLPLVLITTALLVFIKALAAYGSVRLLRFPHKTALWTGVSLFQVGEFSFVLMGRTLDTVSEVPVWKDVLTLWNPVLIDAIIISMFMTPLVLRYFHKVMSPSRKASKKIEGHTSEIDELFEMPNRVVIAGYGPTARNLSAALEEKEVPYTIIEMNLKTVRKLQAKGLSCIYGDVSRPEILEAAGIKQAGVLAITFPDIRTAEAAVQTAKQLNSRIHTMVRSRYRVDVDRLYKLGVDNVVYEEFETSVSFVFNIMKYLDYPILETDRLISKIRETENSLFKEPVTEEHAIFGRFSLLEGTKIEWIEINPDSDVVNKTLQEAQIRQRTGVNVISVINAEDKSQCTPDPHYILNAYDVLVVVGTLEQLHALEHLLYG